MATVTGYTAARMKTIEDNSIVSGQVTSGNLILTKYNGQTVNAGSVVGPTGPQGATGATGPQGTSGVIAVTSSTRPGSPTTGQVIYETDTGRIYVWNGSAWKRTYEPGAWQSFTPVWTASGGTNPNLGTTGLANEGRYFEEGKLIHLSVSLKMGSGASGGSGTWFLALPVNARNAFSYKRLGVFEAYGAATVVGYNGTACLPATDGTKVQFQLQASGNGSAGSALGSGTRTWAVGDEMHVMLTYEAA